MLLGLVVGVANAVVLLGGRGAKTDPQAVPHAQAALVLGALVQPDGRPVRRCSRTASAPRRRCIATGRVDKVLASGDHGRPDYDEVNAMRRELVRLGVPDDDVFTDHAGFATLDSVVRARKVFNVHSVTVVTQPFHMPRALWLARHAGLTAYGLEAGAGNGYGSKGTASRVREVLRADQGLRRRPHRRASRSSWDRASTSPAAPTPAAADRPARSGSSPFGILG